MPPSVQRVYIDTMVFVYRLLRTTHRLYPKSYAFFSDIENQKYVGVTTTFTHAEYRAVVRKLLSEGQDSPASSSDVDAEIVKLDKYLKDMGIELFNADVVAQQIPLTVFYRVEQLIGASSSIKGGDGKWRTIGGADAIAVTLAEIVKADLFATCDQGFKVMSGTTIKPLMISEVY
jgi:predicted nucleic acid-binding protein